MRYDVSILKDLKERWLTSRTRRICTERCTTHQVKILNIRRTSFIEKHCARSRHFRKKETLLYWRLIKHRISINVVFSFDRKQLAKDGNFITKAHGTQLIEIAWSLNILLLSSDINTVVTIHHNYISMSIKERRKFTTFVSTLCFLFLSTL